MKFKSCQLFIPTLFVITLLRVVMLQEVLADEQSATGPKAIIKQSGPDSERCVITLHGLARTASSMSKLGEQLAEHSYSVVNIGYPSRYHTIEILSELALPAGLNACRERGSSIIYVVTHSLGGILVRDYLDRHSVPELQRIVMLAPPNHGSAVVDGLSGVPGVVWLNGPAFTQLGSQGSDSVPLRLGPISVDTAVIAGTRSVNLYLSTFLDNPDDGKVSVASARLPGMCAMLTLAVSHPFIMKDDEAIEQVLSYLATGRFTKQHAEYIPCAH